MPNQKKGQRSPPEEKQETRPGAGIALIVVGVVLVGNVDVVIRPAVYKHFAQIHPLVTLVGAIAGVSSFGLLGILIGPLALSYFFELIRMYSEEYPPLARHTPPAATPAATPPAA